MLIRDQQVVDQETVDQKNKPHCLKVKSVAKIDDKQPKQGQSPPKFKKRIIKIRRRIKPGVGNSLKKCLA
jgi:hypothetical protein